MDLLLIRHAEPVRVERTDGGQADPSLHERGREQARRLGEWLADEHLDRLCCSPLRRARETAVPLGHAVGLAPTVDEGVAEYDRDSSWYVPIEELRAAGDERWQAMVKGEYFGEGVDPGDFTARVIASIQGIVGASPGQRVAVVCHGGVINVYLAWVLGLGARVFFEPRYTSVSRVVASRSGARTLVSINETGHLRGLPGF